MAALQEKTRHPGIYKRGETYLVRYRTDDGRRPAETCRTLEQALRIKRERESARDKGELDLVVEARVPLREYATEWVEHYQGNGKRGFTDDTRAEYRRDFDRYVLPKLGDRQLSAIKARDVRQWLAWLCNERGQGERRAAELRAAAERKGKAIEAKVEPVFLTDATVRRILSPLRACLATARLDGLIRANPCDGVPLPHRPQIEEAGEEKAKAMTRGQLAMFLRVVPTDWSLLFRVLAATGVRWSELAALQWGDFNLDYGESEVRVRRSLARVQQKGGGPPRFKVPKSRYGVRTIPLDVGLVRDLKRRRREAERSGDDDLVFAARNGAPLRQENVRRRVMAIAGSEAGVPWVGFHTFRHTCASLLFAEGRNVKQVQRWLGHHSPAFTLDTYVHLLDDGVGGGLNLGIALADVDLSELTIPSGAEDEASQASPESRGLPSIEGESKLSPDPSGPQRTPAESSEPSSVT